MITIERDPIIHPRDRRTARLRLPGIEIAVWVGREPWRDWTMGLYVWVRRSQWLRVEATTGRMEQDR